MNGALRIHLTGWLWGLECKSNLVETLVSCRGLAKEGTVDVIPHLRPHGFPPATSSPFLLMTWEDSEASRGPLPPLSIYLPASGPLHMLSTLLRTPFLPLSSLTSPGPLLVASSTHSSLNLLKLWLYSPAEQLRKPEDRGHACFHCSPCGSSSPRGIRRVRGVGVEGWRAETPRLSPTCCLCPLSPDPFRHT